MGNVQDAVGDTMNFGTIAIHGSAGDAVGYAMRGGEIYVRDNAGYRAGIHMKAYADRFPVIVIGGKCGSFLGEYQAGGLIIVLGNGVDDDELIGHFCGTGMHGGRIFLAAARSKKTLPAQVKCSEADAEDIASVEKYLKKYEELFGIGAVRDDGKKFYVLRPNTKNPYKQLYVQELRVLGISRNQTKGRSHMYTKNEVIDYVREEDVKFIRLAFTDVHGNPKNISVMPGELPRAFSEVYRSMPRRLRASARG